MAFTQAQIDKLKAAIAAGVLTVKNGDDTVTYRSLAEMQAILSMMEGEVSGTRIKRTVAGYRSGLTR